MFGSGYIAIKAFQRSVSKSIMIIVGLTEGNFILNRSNIFLYKTSVLDSINTKQTEMDYVEKYKSLFIQICLK